MKEVEKMSDLSLKAFGDSVSALLRLDRKVANEAIGLTRRVKELDEKISGELLALKTDPDTFGSIKLILESIRRVGEYGADIAEIAVDLTVKEPSPDPRDRTGPSRRLLAASQSLVRSS